MILLFIIFIILLFTIYDEQFLNITGNSINYYVIHISSNIERKNNIIDMEKKINKKIKIFDAIMGTDLLMQYSNNKNKINNINITKIMQYDNYINYNFNYKTINEVGCYLSHFVLIKSLLNTHYQYTLIFEDDFYIVNDDFNEQLNNILDKIEVDFDLLFLGTTTNNCGLKYKDEIHYVDKNTCLHGTHAYVINNKNINKIYNYLLNFDSQIDVKYQELIKHDKLIGFIVYPHIVDQDQFRTTIQN